MVAAILFCLFSATASGLVAAGSSWSVVGGIIFGAIGLLAIVVGAVTVMIFGKSRFQILLEGCIWGSGKEHLFYNEVASLKSKEDVINWGSNIEDVKVIDAYSKENQEFMNLLYHPSVDIDVDRHFTDAQLGILPRTNTYKFKLPAFQPGLSNLEAEIHTDFKEKDGQIKSSSSHSLNLYLKKAINDAEISLIDGTAEFEIKLNFDEDVTLYWSYFPTS